MTRVAPVGKKIAEFRKARGLKQADFARDVGVSESTLRKVETRDYEVPRKTLEEIANKLQVEVTQVLRKPEVVSSADRDDEVELRPVSSSGLIDLLRWLDYFYSEVHVDVTREMVDPMRVILDIAELFRRRRREGNEVFAEYYPLWHAHPELYASAEITTAIDRLKELGVAVLANRKYREHREWHVGVSFEKLGVTSRIIDICPF